MIPYIFYKRKSDTIVAHLIGSPNMSELVMPPINYWIPQICCHRA